MQLLYVENNANHSCLGTNLRISLLRKINIIFFYHPWSSSPAHRQHCTLCMLVGQSVGFFFLTLYIDCTSILLSGVVVLPLVFFHGLQDQADPVLVLAGQAQLASQLFFHSQLMLQLFFYSQLASQLFFHSQLVSQLFFHAQLVSQLFFHSQLVSQLFFHSQLVSQLFLHSQLVSQLLFHAQLVSQLFFHSQLTSVGVCHQGKVDQQSRLSKQEN